MADYIKRKDAILEIQRNGVGCFDPDDFLPEQAERFVISCLNAVPSADVREVVHARWLDGYRRQPCPICCYKGMRSWRFCPQCGAQMDADMREVDDGT